MPIPSNEEFKAAYEATGMIPGYHSFGHVNIGVVCPVNAYLMAHKPDCTDYICSAAALWDVTPEVVWSFINGVDCNGIDCNGINPALDLAAFTRGREVRGYLDGIVRRLRRGLNQVCKLI